MNLPDPKNEQLKLVTDNFETQLNIYNSVLPRKIKAQLFGKIGN